jgi:hypothetical protein
MRLCGTNPFQMPRMRILPVIMVYAISLNYLQCQRPTILPTVGCAYLIQFRMTAADALEVPANLTKTLGINISVSTTNTYQMPARSTLPGWKIKSFIVTSILLWPWQQGQRNKFHTAGHPTLYDDSWLMSRCCFYYINCKFLSLPRLKVSPLT